MKIGIDASNISSGGGVTHLVSLLRAAAPGAHNVTEVVIWAPSRTLALIEDRSWLMKRSVEALEKGYLRRGVWQRFELAKRARQEDCDLLFVPGGSFVTDFRPVVTMSRNMLPFEWREMARYGLSTQFLKMVLLRWTQSQSFLRANGVIFLSEYARNTVLGATGPLAGEMTIVPHGVDGAFFAAPRKARVGSADADPLRLLYVSPIEPYKHQWNVLEAVAVTRRGGFPVKIDFVGPLRNAARRFEMALKRCREAEQFVTLRGGIPHQQLPDLYRSADLFIYASSSENLPNVLLEAMASGLPIACSDRGPMPDVLGDAGVYFDPEDPESIAQAIVKMVASPDLRDQKAHAAFHRARQYSWERCASETFDFLVRVYNTYALERTR